MRGTSSVFRLLHMTAVKRLYPLVALAAITFAVAGVLTGPGASMNVSVSEYAVTGRGGVTELATAVMALGSLALLGGLRAAGAPVRGMPGRLFMVWSGALAVTAVIPATPLGPEQAVQAHQWALAAALVSLPAAAALLVPRLAADADWRPVARVVEWLALAGGLGVLALTYVALPGGGVLIGLVEWALLGAEVALLAVLAGWLVRVVWLGSVRHTTNFPTYHGIIASRS
ncbi:hypothetical protein GCM10012278_67170 [Nonomuraea glycinis]|uniref:DUF998 domain-containing protein n=2 Tax=Nonomuraea glycinis TaxID=2047744 RepID=A0A918ADY1_9ACTN|nr:hypothetical protein GCM10012278_67170 [Nonomuraea glycinis]